MTRTRVPAGACSCSRTATSSSGPTPRRAPASRWPDCSTCPTACWARAVDLIIAITTNEPLTRLHPAITRPGRCLAEIEVGPLSASEARAWLGRPVAAPDGGLTLAELYARRGDLQLVSDEPAPLSTGQYL